MMLGWQPVLGYISLDDTARFGAILGASGGFDDDPIDDNDDFTDDNDGLFESYGDFLD